MYSRQLRCPLVVLTNEGMIRQFPAMTDGADQLNYWIIPLKIRYGIGETGSEMQLTVDEEPVPLGVKAD